MAIYTKNNNYLLWQWNCRGYRRKRPILQQLLASLKVHPEVIALQETGGASKLIGYQAFNATGDKPNVTTFVRRNITAIEHDTGIRHIEHVLVELIPATKTQRSLFILNIYSTPSQKKVKFDSLFRKVMRIGNKHALVILGDFNAHHPAWGYPRPCTKGESYG